MVVVGVHSEIGRQPTELETDRRVGQLVQSRMENCVSETLVLLQTWSGDVRSVVPWFQRGRCR